MQEQDQDRTEPATPYKREEARRRGQVAKSLDTNSFAVMAGALVSMVIWGPSFIRSGAAGFRSLLQQASTGVPAAAYLHRWMGEVLTTTLTALAPLFVAVLLAAVLANFLQTGGVFTVYPLKPDPQRLNPARGFKRIYSLRAVFETLKSLVKLLLFAAVAWSAIGGLLPRLVALGGADPHAYPLALLRFGETVAFKLLLVLLLIALLDWAYVRWDYDKRLRMSRREQKEEVKRREGDPHVRARLRELQREAARRNRSLRRVPEADVLITNPTHVAVALKYERGQATAPRCVAKGSGEIAQHMRRLALRSGVRVFEQRTLAQALFAQVAIDALIPESLYEPVARIYARLAPASVPGAPPRAAVEVRT